MSRLTSLTKNLTDISSKDPFSPQLNYQYKKVPNIHKFTGLFSTNSNSLNKNNNFQNHYLFPEKNYAHKFFNEKESNNNNSYNANNTKQNININTSTIINPFPEKNNIFQKYVTINDIIGEKYPLSLEILNLIFNNYEPAKISKKSMSLVKSYAVNTYQGLVRNYNEDRVSIIINMNKPKNFFKKKWPKISFFGIYDGHGGEGCSEFLRDKLHKYICENDYFPDDIPQAIKYGISKAEYEFLNKYALNENEEIKDKSGSCAIIVLIVENEVFIANVGDSRCLLSMDEGKKYIEVTKDHKPNSENEKIRINKNGGNIYQSQTVINNLGNNLLNGKILIGPYRVMPGRLSVCRTIGDVEAKLEKFGGNKNVIISTPDIYYYDLKKNNLDFFILGCDGIYDQMTNKEIIDLAWEIINLNKNENENINIDNNYINDIHYKSGLIVDLVIKASLARKSFDNVTCVFISFKDFYTNDNIINNDKIYTIRKKSNILNKKIIKDKMPNVEENNKCKTYRNEKRKELFNNITAELNDKNIVNKIFNTESKFNKLNINPYQNSNKNRDMSSDLINYKEDNNNINNNILSHNKIKTNIFPYSKKNQSFNRYSIKKNNKKDINRYSVYTTKKISQQNLNLNIHNKINKPLKLIEPNNHLTARTQKLNTQNKSSIILNNMKNNMNKKFLKKISDNNSYNNSTYLLINNSINNFDNLHNFDNFEKKDLKINTTQSDINQNEKFKKILFNINPIKSRFNYNKNEININNISSDLSNNRTLKKPKKYLYLNNTQNLNTHKNKNNYRISIGNNLMINRYINNAFTSKMKRELTSKMRQLSSKKTRSNINISNQNVNISMQNIQSDKYLIYNYADRNNKMNNHNIILHKNTDLKNYKSPLNDYSNSNNNHLNTDLGNKTNFFFEDSKKGIY